MVYLGTERHGIGEKFTIVILTHHNKQRFSEGEILEGLPADCGVSDPVTILRTR
jgi:hypothetical protein